MENISLYLNPGRDGDLSRTARVIKALSPIKGRLFMEEGYRGAAKLLPFGEKICFVPEEELFRKGDLLMTLGGDGTILSVAARAARARIPIFGVNFGKVGFMTSLEEKEISRLPELLAGKYATSSRMLLSCRVGKGEPFCALNEFIVARETGFRIVNLRLDVNGEKFCDFRADGLIFNTPTGSTGYSFSAGGAVMDAETDAIGVKAVCSYLLINAHHMIFSPETVFTVRGGDGEEGVITVCADGREKRTLPPGEEIRIARGEERLELVFLEKRSNLEVFFRKF